MTDEQGSDESGASERRAEGLEWGGERQKPYDRLVRVADTSQSLHLRAGRGKTQVEAVGHGDLAYVMAGIVILVITGVIWLNGSAAAAVFIGLLGTFLVIAIYMLGRPSRPSPPLSIINDPQAPAAGIQEKDPQDQDENGHHDEQQGEG